MTDKTTLSANKEPVAIGLTTARPEIDDTFSIMALSAGASAYVRTIPRIPLSAPIMTVSAINTERIIYLIFQPF